MDVRTRAKNTRLHRLFIKIIKMLIQIRVKLNALGIQIVLLDIIVYKTVVIKFALEILENLQTFENKAHKKKDCKHVLKVVVISVLVIQIVILIQCVRIVAVDVYVYLPVSYPLDQHRHF